jgi:hypothetical protein
MKICPVGSNLFSVDGQTDMEKLIVVVVSVVSYGAETWTMTKKEEEALLIFERKIFRRIYGPKNENGEWKIRTNRELEQNSKGENIVK